MAERAIAFVSGLLFALGLCVAGMTDPAKVRAFLDLGGAWDPSLLLVMGAAVPVHAVAWWLVRRRGGPLLGGGVPPRPAPVFDARLIGGATVFGVGWALGGVCPGPGVVSAVAGSGALWFVPAMLAGMVISRWVARAPAMEDESDAGPACYPTPEAR